MGGMSIATTLRWATIERRSPALFLGGGLLLVGHAALLGVQTLSRLSTPPDVFGPAGNLLALAGLLGLYPALVDRTPRAARVAAAVTAVALVGWGLLTAARLLAVVGFVGGMADVLPAAVVLVTFAATVLAYLVVGVAILRVDDGTARLGWLVLAPAGLIASGLALSAGGAVPAVAALGIGGGQALSVLALGSALRAWTRPADRAVVAVDLDRRVMRDG